VAVSMLISAYHDILATQYATRDYQKKHVCLW